MSIETKATASPPSHIPRLLLALILSISAFIQFSVVSRTVVDNPLRADAGEYFNYAYNLHKYGVYSSARTWDKSPAPAAPAPDKVRSPGYPIFLLLAGTPQPSEKYVHRVTMIQAALAVGSTWLAYLIAATFLGRGMALGVALLTATAPQMATTSTYLLTECLFTFLLLASVLALINATKAKRPVWYVLAGILWGLCSLVRPTVQFFPLLLLLAAFVIPRLRAYRVPALIVFGSFLLALSPWAVRNQSAALRDSSSSLIVGTLAHGSYPQFMYDGRPETFGFPYRFDPNITEITKDLPSVLRHIGGQFQAHPAEYMKWYLLGKPYYFLSLENVQSFDIMIYPTLRSPYYEDLKFAVLRSVAVKLHWPLVVLGVAGMFLLALGARLLQLDEMARLAATLVALLLAYAIAFHMIVAPFPRYSIPFRPLIYALAALPLRAIWLAFRKTP